MLSAAKNLWRHSDSSPSCLRTTAHALSMTGAEGLGLQNPIYASLCRRPSRPEKRSFLIASLKDHGERDEGRPQGSPPHILIHPRPYCCTLVVCDSRTSIWVGLVSVKRKRLKKRRRRSMASAGQPSLKGESFLALRGA